MRTISILSLLGLLLCSFTTKTTVTIKCKPNATILINDVNLTTSNPDFSQTIKADEQGIIRQELDLKEDRFLVYSFPNSEQSFSFPVEKGGNYLLKASDDKIVMEEGANIEGVKAYQEMPKYSHAGSVDWRIFTQSSLPRDSVISQSKANDLKILKDMLDHHQISTSFYELVKDDRDCFYAFVSAWLYNWDLMGIINGKKSISREEVLNKLKKLYITYNPNNYRLMKTPTWDSYAVFMFSVTYSQFLEDIVTKENLNDLIHPAHIAFWTEFVKKNFLDEAQEAALSLLLYQFGGEKMVCLRKKVFLFIRM